MVEINNKKKTCTENTNIFLISPEANAKEKDQLKKEKKVIYAKHLWHGAMLTSLLASKRSNIFKLCTNVRLKSKPHHLKCKLACELQVSVCFKARYIWRKGCFPEA